MHSVPKIRECLPKTWVAPHSNPRGGIIQCIWDRFHEPFVSSYGNKYILVLVDYLSKWIKVVALRTREGKCVVQFLKWYIFTRFGTLWAIISDGGTFFVTGYLDHYYTSMGWSTRLQFLITYKLVVKWSCWIERLRLSWKRSLIQTGSIDRES